ncbi:histidine phosphatase family protein [Nonomuraea sp. MCN248]|uniref:Histidine phosphatase family protein n=1 Tax=Nonomuraea corallina TaxID=2989783 RepID=A0ABT4S5F8_9ACTN|nr:histidine phosphatase family protein [Nonomuraea corallina]MDA0632160.1 histidine phosphatase family protein [Nonomuraea corallina]
MSVEIVYETHSISVHNETGIASGWLPGELSERGLALAAELGERRRDDGLDAVFSSDLYRAVQTARVALGDSGIPLFQDRRLRECHYGEFDGMPVSLLEARRARHINEPWPGGQSYRDVVEQTSDFLAELAVEWDGKKVLLISHSANRWALQHLLHDVPLAELVDQPFDWQPGWTFHLPGGWVGRRVQRP